ncbi:MAG: hypothetical protein CML67_03260 [Rhodobacteraceae bacterium]|nr:hypothetical protein [Paracoccaceae bacterium]
MLPQKPGAVHRKADQLRVIAPGPVLAPGINREAAEKQEAVNIRPEAAYNRLEQRSAPAQARPSRCGLKRDGL